MTFALVLLLVGAAFTLAGYFGPQDGGTLEAAGLALVVLAVVLAVLKGWT